MNSQTVKAKLKQNYQDKPPARRCRECTHFRFEFETYNHHGELKPCCTLGDFAVELNAICDEFETNNP